MTDRGDDVPVLLISNTETRDQLLLASVLGLLFIAFYAAMVYLGRDRTPRAEDYLSYALFGTMVVLGAGWAVWLLLGRYRFGDLTLEVHGRLALGETVRLRIPVPPQLEAGTTIEVRVHAQSVFKPGKHAEITELWRSVTRLTVPARGVPWLELAIALPSDQQPAQRIPSGQVQWNARVRAELPGVDLVRNFELPVARARGRHPLVD